LRPRSRRRLDQAGWIADQANRFGFRYRVVSCVGVRNPLSLNGLCRLAGTWIVRVRKVALK